MMAIDKDCNCWVVQDRAPSVMKIDAKTGATEQFRVPLPQDSLQMSGPAVATAPDGGIWATLFGDDGGSCASDPTASGRTSRSASVARGCARRASSTCASSRCPSGGTSGRSTASARRVNWPVFNVFLISSNLLDDEAMNMIMHRLNPYVAAAQSRNSAKPP